MIVSLLGLLRNNAKIVLVPVEVKIEDLESSNGIYVSDNKEYDGGIFINDDLSLTCPTSIYSSLKTDQLNEYDLYFYTSGSTGKAKLIGKKYSNFITEISELKTMFNSSKPLSFYATPPLYHIYGFLFGFMLPLVMNGKLYIDYIFTPDSISDFVKSNNVDFFISTPSYYDYFVKLDLINSFIDCQKLTSSSAPLSLETSRFFFEKNVSITEIYGSTETGGIASRVSAENKIWKPFSYVKTKPPIYIDSESSISSLRIDSDAISVTYDRVEGYDTGDLVKFSENGFELAGRNLRFVKIAGKRLDLDFVAAKFINVVQEIYKIDIIANAVITGLINEKIYIAFEINSEIQIDALRIKEELKKHLPGYAVPRILKQIKIPKNVLGKIDRKQIESLIS